MRTFEMPFQTTRGALDVVLKSFGFQPAYAKNEFDLPVVSYRHPTGALVALRDLPAEEPLSPSDFLSAEHSVEWWGISDRETFYKSLRDVTQDSARAA